ncbi:hypothetical protein CYMTET_16049 [Cymbomonas tetramitiformis]|uniref:Uncharacterized protein n=1 Tax=Cymbomonas tetramitiformis TaxID=36881 RepID=A0AAE0L8J3_9CHLO|nr:hypothetical protein CYMTET_16049 [Cymbomonas tetramitiformis]
MESPDNFDALAEAVAAKRFGGGSVAREMAKKAAQSRPETAAMLRRVQAKHAKPSSNRANQSHERARSSSREQPAADSPGTIDSWGSQDYVLSTDESEPESSAARSIRTSRPHTARSSRSHASGVRASGREYEPRRTSDEEGLDREHPHDSFENRIPSNVAGKYRTRKSILKQTVFNFQDSHPLRASKHCYRSKVEEAEIERAKQGADSRQSKPSQGRAHQHGNSATATLGPKSYYLDSPGDVDDSSLKPARGTATRPQSAHAQRAAARPAWEQTRPRSRETSVSPPKYDYKRQGQALNPTSLSPPKYNIGRRAPEATDQELVAKLGRRADQSAHVRAAAQRDTEEVRVSQEYVNRLESEIARLQGSIQELRRPQPYADAVEPQPEVEFSFGGRAAVAERSRQRASLADHLASSSNSQQTSSLRHASDGRRAAHVGNERGGSEDGLGQEEAESLAEEEEGFRSDLDEADADAYATGKYTDQRFSSYNDELDAVMEGRRTHGGYDSDHERRDLKQASTVEALGLEKAAASLEEVEQDRICNDWLDNDEWMNKYRVHEECRPVQPAPAARASVRESMTMEDLLAEYRGKRGIVEEVETYHSDSEIVSPNRSYSQGLRRSQRIQHDDHIHHGCMQYLGDGPHGDGFPRPDALIQQATNPQPFSFDRREAVRPKSIMQERLEQDLAIAAEKEEANRIHGFKARPLPASVTEPRYMYMVEQAQYTREKRIEERNAKLITEAKPFSFYYRYEASRKKQQEFADEQTVKRGNRFIRKFQANDVPMSTLEPRYHQMEAMDEQRKAYRKHQAYQKWKEAKMPPRLEMHDRAGQKKKKQERRAFGFNPATERPLGYVPDFDTMHERFQSNLRVVKRTKPITEPEPFQLSHKSKKHSMQSQENRRKTLVDMAFDEHELPEQRWPYTKGARAKVIAQPKPVMMPMSEADLRRMETASAYQRRTAVKNAINNGEFDDREGKERRDAQRRMKEAEVRAAAWVKAQKKMMGEDPEADDDPLGGSTDNGAKASSSKDKANIPKQHVDARMAQEEEKAKEVVEQILLQNDVYTYVEEE